jgi:hypothetical protein
MRDSLPSAVRENNSAQYVAVLIMKDGTRPQSVHLSYADADSVGRLSMLDDDVLGYVIDPRPAGKDGAA